MQANLRVVFAELMTKEWPTLNWIRRFDKALGLQRSRTRTHTQPLTAGTRACDRIGPKSSLAQTVYEQIIRAGTARRS